MSDRRLVNLPPVYPDRCPTCGGSKEERWCVTWPMRIDGGGHRPIEGCDPCTNDDFHGVKR